MQMTIRKAIRCLNNVEENGGYWLPNIQRPFVWREEQIERLFDSVMRSYPISTLLAWRTKERVKHRRFIDLYKRDFNLLQYYHEANSEPKYLVLDGQQRLQSLYIGIKGTYENKHLCFNILSGDLVAPDDIRYKFKFLHEQNIQSPWFKVSDLIMNDELNKRIRDNCAKKFEDDDYDFDHKDLDCIEMNVDLIRKKFVEQETINIQILDSIEEPNKYTEDDVVEIFIRCNAGGTILGKSDLLFSLLTVSWDDADENIAELLEKLNAEGYRFTRDFILKTCLTILKKGAAYNVQKFRNPGLKEEIKKNWRSISEAICDVKDFLYSETYVKTDKALSSYLTLIPLVYFRYNFKSKWTDAKEINKYILRTLFAGAFSGNPDNVIDSLIKRIDIDQDFVYENIVKNIRANGRSLEVSKESILNENCHSGNIHLIFNILYRDFHYTPAYKNNLPQVDHIFPQKLLKQVTYINPETGRPNMKYKAMERDQIGNLMLLKAGENGAGGKSDTPPDVWFANKDNEYLEKHLIPKKREYWKLENFELFVKERQDMIINRLKDYIINE